MRDESNELIDLSGKSWRFNKKTNVASFSQHFTFRCIQPDKIKRR
ncbi:MAG: hypothetical protein Rpha_1258 [Candidatus Ruthia sp. Apha_13_S6]|nr:hypothetical protein [Candidatus Ruthia sp. Apha_13_S6]